MDSLTRASTEELTVSQDGPVVWLEMNRPHALNALTPSLVSALSRAVGAAAADSRIRVVILIGAGRAFCAGADLKEAEKRSKLPAGNVEFIRAAGALTNLIESCPKPVIAAVNGVAVAGGLELVLACDLAIAAESAKLGDAHSNFALFPGAGATVRLPRRLGVSSAKYLMFTGEMIPATEACSLGLINKVVADTALRDAVRELSAKLAGKSPLVLARLKEAISDSMRQCHDVAMRRERDLNELHSLSFDRAEGLAAFREKRTPQFLGK